MRSPWILRSRHEEIVDLHKRLVRLTEESMERAREENTLLRRQFGLPEVYKIRSEWEAERVRDPA